MTNLPALREAVAKVPDLAWLGESGTGWCDDAENAAIMAVLTAAPALLDEVEAARADAAHGSSPMVALVAERDAARAEVEAAARFCYLEGWNDVAHERGCDFNAAWSRYQQERKG